MWYHALLQVITNILEKHTDCLDFQGISGPRREYGFPVYWDSGKWERRKKKKGYGNRWPKRMEHPLQVHDSVTRTNHTFKIQTRVKEEVANSSL